MSTQIKVNKTPTDGSKDSFGSGTESQIRSDKCFVCLNGIKDARMLNCLHSFCHICLLKIHLNERIVCPECKAVTYVSSLEKLPIDYTKVTNPSQKASSSCDMCSSKDQPESFCIDCNTTLCSFCTRSHRRQRLTKEHTIESLDLVPIYCQSHPEEKVSLFCDHCDCLACRDCAITSHRGHSCNFINDVESEFRGEFVDKIDKSEEKLMNLTDYLEDIREKKIEINTEAQKLVEEIQRFTASYISQIQSHSEKLIEKVQKNRYKKIQNVEEVISQIEQLENQTEHTLNISRVACNMEGSYMLSMMDHITRRLDRLDDINQTIKSEKKEMKLKFDRKSQKVQGDFVICGDIYLQKRAKSCHILSHRVTQRQLTLGKAYEINIDVSDSLDVVDRDDLIVTFASPKCAGKWKVVPKNEGVFGLRFMAQTVG